MWYTKSRKNDIVKTMFITLCNKAIHSDLHALWRALQVAEKDNQTKTI